MNHLAHLLLADPEPSCRLGNILADYISARDAQPLSHEIRRGIQMHQRIDAFTDNHPVVQQSLARLGDTWGWFRGILIDVYYDFILGLNWNNYHAEPLPQFLEVAHADLLHALSEVPDPAAKSIRYIVSTNRLGRFADPAGSGVLEAYERITAIIAHRIPNRAVNLVPAFVELQQHHAELTSDFQQFFPELQAFAARWSAENPS